MKVYLVQLARQNEGKDSIDSIVIDNILINVWSVKLETGNHLVEVQLYQDPSVCIQKVLYIRQPAVKKPFSKNYT